MKTYYWLPDNEAIWQNDNSQLNNLERIFKEKLSLPRCERPEILDEPTVLFIPFIGLIETVETNLISPSNGSGYSKRCNDLYEDLYDLDSNIFFIFVTLFEKDIPNFFKIPSDWSGSNGEIAFLSPLTLVREDRHIYFVNRELVFEEKKNEKHRLLNVLSLANCSIFA